MFELRSIDVESYKALYSLLEQNFAVKVCLEKKQGLHSSYFNAICIKICARKTLTRLDRLVSDICLQNSYNSDLHNTAHKTQPRKPCRLGELYFIYNEY